MVVPTVLPMVVGALLAATLVGLVRWHALRRGLLDRPNARSSHLHATARGGGLGVVVALVATLAVLGGAGLRDHGALAAAVAVMIVAAIGWVDDHGGSPVRLRLAVHLAAGVLLLPFVGEAPVPRPLVGLSAAWWVFWTVSAINVVNFMDGIDGIIGLQALVMGTFVALLGAPDGEARVVGAAVVGTSLGFLYWNWSPARIFLGDVGSGALGVIAVVAGAALAREGRVGFIAAFAPLAPIFLDAALTLARRARRRERLSEAHRSHLYQRLANGGYGHARVSVGFGAASVLCAVAAAVFPQGELPLLGGLLAVGVPLWFLLDRSASPSA